MSDRDTITLPREVVQEALDALEWAWGCEHMRAKKREAITALRTALAAEPPKPARLHATTTGVLLGSAWLVWNTPKGANDEIMSQETADLLNRMFAENEALRRDAERYEWLKAKVEDYDGHACFPQVPYPAPIPDCSPFDAVDAAIDAAMEGKR